jgi:site-specific DNA recombinase
LATPIAGSTNSYAVQLRLWGALALREGKTDRSIRMTLSLAFLAPNIVKAAVGGRLPRGFGLKRLVDLPIAWPDQWLALGLEAPAHA